MKFEYMTATKADVWSFTHERSWEEAEEEALKKHYEQYNDSVFYDPTVTKEEKDRYLACRGEAGWELISVDEGTYYFKRVIND